MLYVHHEARHALQRKISVSYELFYGIYIRDLLTLLHCIALDMSQPRFSGFDCCETYFCINEQTNWRGARGCYTLFRADTT